MYTPYLPLGTVEVLIELVDMFGVEKEFMTFDYYKRTGKKIWGQHIRNLESGGYIRKIARLEKSRDHPRGGVYVITNHAMNTIERYSLREGIA